MTTHLNKKTKPTIVDISKKKQTLRIAIAQGIIQFSKKTFQKIKSLKTKKGEITNTAIIAGILGAKKTSEIIPLCHNIMIENVDIDILPMNNKNLFVDYYISVIMLLSDHLPYSGSESLLSSPPDPTTPRAALNFQTWCPNQCCKR